MFIPPLFGGEGFETVSICLHLLCHKQVNALMDKPASNLQRNGCHDEKIVCCASQASSIPI
jgi:hypothetical protein